MGILYLKTVWWTIPFGVELLSALWINIFFTGRIVIGWVTCVGQTISGYFETSALQLRRWNICTLGGDLCVVSCAIVLVKSGTDVLLDCVVVAIFDNAIVWSCCVNVNNAALPCVDFAFSTYPLVFEVLEDLRVSLNALMKWVLKLLQVLSSLCLRDHSRQLSWYIPIFFDDC